MKKKLIIPVLAIIAICCFVLFNQVFTVKDEYISRTEAFHLAVTELENNEKYSDREWYEILQVTSMHAIKYMQDHEFTFASKYNGLPLGFNQIKINIDVITGELTLREFGKHDTNHYNELTDLITIEEAALAYQEQMKNNLIYQLAGGYSGYLFDNEVRLIYDRSFYDNERIDATNGQYYNQLDQYPTIYSYKYVPIDFSEIEQEYFLKKHCLDKKDIKSGILEPLCENIENKTWELMTISGDMLERYVWKGFDDKYMIAIDAVTGDLIEYKSIEDRFNDTELDIEKLDISVAIKSAEDFLKIYAFEKYSLCLFEEQFTDEEEDEYLFYYYRYHDGIPVYANGFEIKVNMFTGQITSFLNVWYDDITFPDTENMLDEKSAFHILDDALNFTLGYELDAEKRIIPAYFFSNKELVLVDAVTGELVTKLGHVIGHGTRPDYYDLAEHKSADDINALCVVGCYIEGPSQSLYEQGYFYNPVAFRPDEQISSQDFLIYLTSTIDTLMDNEDVNEFLKSKDIKFGINESITKGEASRFFVDFLKKVHRSYYSDTIIHAALDPDPFVICQRLGIYGEDDKEDETLSRGDAASAIRNYYKVSIFSE